MAGEIRITLAVLMGLLALVTVAMCLGAGSSDSRELPAAATKGKVSLEEALARRRSIRRFKPQPLTRQQIAQLCWAGQGISEPARGLRTCPSAGALYPLELYVVTAEAVEHYIPARHATAAHAVGDLRGRLSAAALGQSCVRQAPVTFVIAADISRMERKYGRRATKYVLMEVGHAAQNILLQATAMDLGAVPVGAFEDEKIAEVLSLPESQSPFYLIPVGVPER